jgi:DNA-binding transcriptional LysR family regulator
MIKELSGDYIQWLRGFYHVAKTGSFSLAGAEIGRNQPAISHQIKCLEKEYGVTLFDRSKSKMELTPEGRILFEKAISIFDLMESTRQELSQSHNQLTGEIRIVATHAVIDSYLPPYIVAFRRLHPQVTFDMYGGGLEWILEKVLSSEADFGFLNLRSVPSGVTYHHLFNTSLVALTAKGSSVIMSNKPSLAEIAEHPFIFFPGTSTINPFIKGKFAEKGLDLKVVMVLNNFEIVKKYVKLGIGMTIMDDFTLTDDDRQHLSVYSLDHLFPPRRYGMIARKTKYLSPPIRAFMKSIKPDIEL